MKNLIFLDYNATTPHDREVIAALYIRETTQLAKLIHGAGQERGRRAGTENVLEIVGLGKACEIAKRDLEENASHMKAMRDRLYDGLRDKLKKIRLNGHPEMHLPNTLSLSLSGVDANALLSEIEDHVAASAGFVDIKITSKVR